MADVGLAVNSAVGNVGRSGPDFGRRLFLALEQYHELVVRDVGGLRFAEDDVLLRQLGRLDGEQVGLPRETLADLAFLVGRLVDLGVHDDSNVDAAVERLFQGVGYWLVAKFVKAAQQAVALSGVGDKPEDRVVEAAAEPLPRPCSFRRVGLVELIRGLVVELPGVGLAAGHAAIEEHVVFELGEQRLGPYLDRYRRGAAIEIFRSALQRVENIFVLAIGLGGGNSRQKTLVSGVV